MEEEQVNAHVYTPFCDLDTKHCAILPLLTFTFSNFKFCQDFLALCNIQFCRLRSLPPPQATLGVYLNSRPYGRDFT